MKSYFAISVAFLLTLSPLANTSDPGSDTEKPYHVHGNNGPQGVEYSEYADYGSKLHHPTRTMGWNNSPENRDMSQIHPEARNNLHKKHVAKSVTANLKLVPNWPDSSKQLGQVAAVDIDKNGNVVVFHRGDRIWGSQTFTYDNIYAQQDLGPIQQNPVVVFHASSGNVVEEWGSNMFYLPHGLTIDSENNVWVTDVALHQVFKFPAGRNSTGKASLTLGEPFIPGKDNNHFCKPTDVAILPNGDFFVSDGYCNSRIIKFDKSGKKLMEWGRSTLSFTVLNGKKPPPDHFFVPHALAVNEESGILFVADRENGRVQCFNTTTGVFIRQLHNHDLIGPRIFSVAYASVQGGLLYIINGPVLGNTSIKVNGFVVSLTSQELVAYFNSDEGFKNPHDIAVKRDGSEVYVVELNPYKVWKFVQGNLNIPIHPPRIENASFISNITPIVPTTYNPKVSSMVDIAAVSPVNTNNSPSRGSIVATVAAIVSVLAVIIIAMTVIVLRIRRGCFSRYYSRHSSHWDFHIPSAEGFKLGQFLDRHQGFEKVSTEESDDEGSAGSANESQQIAQFA